MKFRTITAVVASALVIGAGTANASPSVIDGSAIDCSVGIFSVGVGNFQQQVLPVTTPFGIYPWGGATVDNLPEAVDAYARNCPLAPIHVTGYTYGDIDANNAVNQIRTKDYAPRVTISVVDYPR